MPKTRKAKKQKTPPFFSKPIFRIFLVLFGLGVLFTAGSFSFAATQEQHDPFCASCHTQPESTYYQRSTGAAPVDLASAHTAKKINCIDCHSGTGVLGRISAELLGAHNALAYYTGTAIQPAKLTQPIGDVSCLKCHATVTTQTDFNNHFHAFLSRWQAADPNAAGCTTCHKGHTTDGTAPNMYLEIGPTQNVCQSCHQVLGGGG